MWKLRLKEACLLPKLTAVGNGGDGILQAAALGPHGCTSYAGPSSARQSTPFTPPLPASSPLPPSCLTEHYPAETERLLRCPPWMSSHSTPPPAASITHTWPLERVKQPLNHPGFSEPLRLTHLGPWCLTRFKMQAGPSGRNDSGPPTDARLCSRNKGSILK